MARLVDPKDLLRTDYERARASLRSRYPTAMTFHQRLRYMFATFVLRNQYLSARWDMSFTRSETAGETFRHEVPDGTLDMALSRRGDLQIFLVDESGQAVKYVWDLVGSENHLRESLGWAGVPESQARPLAGRMWSTVGPTPRRFAGFRRWFEGEFSPGLVWIDWGPPP